LRKSPLEDWISEKVSGVTGGELTEEKIRQYQLERLRQTLEYVAEKSAFYSRRLEGFAPKNVISLADWEQLPFTTHQDLRDNGPQLLCVSQSEIQRVVTLASDAIERPRRVYFTRQDLEPTIGFFCHGMSALVGRGQKVLILLPGPRPDSVGDLLARALKRMGVECILHGLVQDPSDTGDEIVKLNIDCLVGLPTQVLSVARRTRTQAIHGRIKSVLLSPEACLGSPDVPSGIVNEIQRILNCPVFKHYGITEMGFGGGVECDALSGYHLREADLYFEIVDEDSGETMPPGQPGEIVFTSLTRKGMPLIRYRTGHFARFLPEPCPCGTVLRRMEKVRSHPNFRGRSPLPRKPVI
jgi:phenylacetate-CoA ligase